MNHLQFPESKLLMINGILNFMITRRQPERLQISSVLPLFLFRKYMMRHRNRAPGEYWTGDGVHASFPGAQLMAQAWMKAVRLTDYRSLSFV